MGMFYVMIKIGQEVWDCLQVFEDEVYVEGKMVYDKVVLVLIDLEMLVMDGFMFM